MKRKSIITSLLIILVSTIGFSQARIQVIHNSADVSAQIVDIYVNDAIFQDDFEFRTSTGFLDVPSGVNLKIDVAAGNSSSSSESVYTMNATLTEGEKYLLVANGSLNSNDADAFQIYVYDAARETANSGMTDLIVFHGSTDAPTVDVYESSIPAGTIVNDLAYGTFAGYLELQTLDYRLQIQDETGSVIVASYEAPLQTLGLDGSALTVLASGFLSPMGDEAAFGLFVALPTGGELVELPVSMSQVQVIHNSADINAEMVDVYLNDELLLDDFMFRTATPFLDLKAAVNTKIDIAPSTSSDVNESIYTLNASLDADNDYILIANGIVGGSGDDAFDIFIYDMAKQDAMTDMTDVLVFHGATDAPTVDVYESSIPAGTIVNDLAYGEFAGYLELQTLDYILDIQDETGTVTVARYEAPLQTLSLNETALTVLASGFLSPQGDEAAFGLFVALPSGGELVELPALSATNIETAMNSNISMYPNPANGFVTVDLQNASNGNVNIYNIAGQLVINKAFSQESYIQLNLGDLMTGMYLVEVKTENGSFFNKLQIAK